MASQKKRFEIQKLEDRIAPALGMVGLGIAATASINAQAQIGLLGLSPVGLSTAVGVGANLGNATTIFGL